MELHEDPFFRAVVSQKASLLIAMRVVVASDREDIEQTLYCDLLAAMSRFDPNKGHRNVFCYRRAGPKRSRHRSTTQGRRNESGKPVSLSTMVCSDDELVELSQCITIADLSRRFGTQPITAQQQAELRRDIETAINHLPEKVRRLAKMLRSYSPTESATRMGIPRNALYFRRAQLRSAMKKAGLEKYLKK